jgi:LPXTG-motif cell wall-anchored protein
VDAVEMVDAPTHVTISKRRISGTDELPGATLKLIDAKGNTIETWVSGKEPHCIVAKLIAGESYTLIEVRAPEGYKTAESIIFVVNTDGSPQMVIMRDAPEGSELPKTGDNMNLMLWLVVLAGSVVLLIVAVAILRKKKRT